MFLEIIYYLTIRPLEILFETVFFLCYRLIGKPFPTIVALSIFVNILVLPLYKHADKLQSGQRAREKSMENTLRHIKKTFKGDEKVLMTQAYYRICNYKPVYALRGASSLLLQIPFFIAAYRFLSGLELLKGMPSVLLDLPQNVGSPVYLIKNLGAPDTMLSINGYSINVLPILMTIINIVSGIVYSKGHLKKEKIQLYITSLIFLVILYNSPSGLVIYWTCNNVFSLCKNVVQRFLEKRNIPSEDKIGKALYRSDNKLFFVCTVFMATMTGLFIPSNILASSSTEFISTYNVFNPARYLFSSFSLGIGFFVIWIGIYYLFSSEKVRHILSVLMAMVCACSIINYMMSGSGLGNLSADLKYDVIPVFPVKSIVLDLILTCCVCILFLLVFKKRTIVASGLILTGAASIIVVSIINIHNINSSYREYNELYASSDEYNSLPKIKLSKTGRNVILILLDRAMGPQMLYMINERPDLLEKFDGFTYYHDTVSFGQFTNFGMPPVYGGYEYTPYEMNKRSDELLKDKTNEALKVLPVLFDQNDYGVTVFDPPYANYKWDSDLSIYDDYPEINAYISKYKFIDSSGEDVYLAYENRKRNFFYFGFMKCVPLPAQNVFYENGNYNNSRSMIRDAGLAFDPNSDEVKSGKVSLGVKEELKAWYTVLDNLTNITEISDNEKGEFLMMYNCTTHDPDILQLPDYTPEMYVDNTAFDVDKFYSINGVKMNMDDIYRVSHYHVNMAALLRIGEWLDYLKAEGIYDNTRIIITADHGSGIGWFDNFTFGEQIFTEWYLPLLLVKDFDEHGFNVSTDLMTNADACVLAVSGDVVEEAVNPFTGNPLDGHQKYDEPLRVIVNENFNVSEFHGYKFTPGDWYALSGSPYNRDNWEYLGFE